MVVEEVSELELSTGVTSAIVEFYSKLGTVVESKEVSFEKFVLFRGTTSGTVVLTGMM